MMQPDDLPDEIPDIPNRPWEPDEPDDDKRNDERLKKEKLNI
jgi:hypothetical protein